MLRLYGQSESRPTSALVSASPPGVRHPFVRRTSFETGRGRTPSPAVFLYGINARPRGAAVCLYRIHEIGNLHMMKVPDEHIQLKYAPNIKGLEFRKFAGEGDYAKLVTIIQESMAFEKDDYLVSIDDLKRFYKYRSNFDPFHDLLIALVRNEMIGFVQMNWDDVSDGTTIYRHIGDVSPKWRRHGIGRALLRHAENHLTRIAERRPEAGPSFFQSRTLETAIGRKRFFENTGYEPVRYFYTMVRKLEGETPVHPLPDGLEIRPAKPQDYEPIWEAMNEAFQDHWEHVPGKDSDFQSWSESPTFQPEMWKIAWEGEQVAGVVLNYIDEEENQAYSRKRGYTEDICARRPWRRRGLALALIWASLQELNRRGMDEAVLGVDTENPNSALRLYERLGYRTNKTSINYRKPLIVSPPDRRDVAGA